MDRRRSQTMTLARGVDILVATLLLAIAAPAMALVAVLIRASFGAPVLFRQTRAGLGGRLFALYKFRTMRDGRPGEPDRARLTPLGTLLRASSIDELPQLWNVLRGDMAIVGPRPLLPRYLHRYTPEQARRHEVRPGITGLAQVTGRNALTWEDKFALDVWYVDHRSLGLDLWILWRTVVALMKRHGVSAAGHATMPEFLGTAERGAPWS